jgi:hypothetical protein
MVCLQVCYACFLADAYLLCNGQPLCSANAKDAADCQVELRCIWEHCLSYDQRHAAAELLLLLLAMLLLLLLLLVPCSLSRQVVGSS